MQDFTQSSCTAGGDCLITQGKAPAMAGFGVCELCRRKFHIECMKRKKDSNTATSYSCFKCITVKATEGRSLSHQFKTLAYIDARPRKKRTIYTPQISDKTDEDSIVVLSTDNIAYAVESFSKNCVLFVPQQSEKRKLKERSKCYAQYVRLLDEKEPHDFMWARWNAYHACWQTMQAQIDAIISDLDEGPLNDVCEFITTSIVNSDGALPCAVVQTGFGDKGMRQLLRGIVNIVKCPTAHLQSQYSTTSKAAFSSLVRQLMKGRAHAGEDITAASDKEKTTSGATLAHLESWYRHYISSAKPETPLVVVVEDFDCFDKDVLHDLIYVLHTYRNASLPLVLVLGVSTTAASIYRTLSQDILSLLSTQLFQLQQAEKYVEAIVDQVLLQGVNPLFLGWNVYQFLFDNFFNHHLSVSNFIRQIRTAVFEHFYSQPLSFLCHTNPPPLPSPAAFPNDQETYDPESFGPDDGMDAGHNYKYVDPEVAISTKLTSWVDSDDETDDEHADGGNDSELRSPKRGCPSEHASDAGEDGESNNMDVTPSIASQRLDPHTPPRSRYATYESPPPPKFSPLGQPTDPELLDYEEGLSPWRTASDLTPEHLNYIRTLPSLHEHVMYDADLKDDSMLREQIDGWLQEVRKYTTCWPVMFEMCYTLAVAAKWNSNGNDSKMRLLYEICSRQTNTTKPVDDDPNMQIIMLILLPTKSRQDNNLEVLQWVIEQWLCKLVEYQMDGSEEFAPLAVLYDDIAHIYHIAKNPSAYDASTEAKANTRPETGVGGTPSKGGGWRQKRQALLRSASGNSSSMATPEDVDSNYAALEAVRKGMREVMRRITQEFLYRSPQSKPMCEVLWYNEGKILRNLVTPTPRGIYHEALSNPTEYLPCECCIKQTGNSKPTPDWEDLCIVYSSLQESSTKNVSLSDWLQKFVDVVNEGKVDNTVASRFSRSIDTLQLLGYISKHASQSAHIRKLN